MSLAPETATWRKPNITFPVAIRIDTARRAIEKTTSNLDSTGEIPPADKTFYEVALLYIQMAEFDLFTKQNLYRSKLSSYFQFREKDTSRTITDGIIYGIAAMRSHAAYQDDVFLTFAANWWNWAAPFVITDDKVATKSFPGKNFTLQTVCSGNSVVGGTFDTSDMNEASVSLLATGSFFVLSSLLAEATSNQTYLEFATRSFTFIRNHLLNLSSSMPFQSINLNSTAPKICESPVSISSHDSGVWIEGLAIFANITDSATKPTRQLMVDSLFKAITYSGWHSVTGILRNPVSGGHHSDIYLPHGLSTLYSRSNDSEIRSYIEKYLAVQHNAILDLSTRNGTDIYAYDWAGPPPTRFDVNAQITALGALIPVIALPDTSASSTASPGATSSSASTSDMRPSVPVGSVVGGVVGGLGGLAILFVLVLYFLRRRHLAVPQDNPPLIIHNEKLWLDPVNIPATSGVHRKERVASNSPGRVFPSGVIPPLRAEPRTPDRRELVGASRGTGSRGRVGYINGETDMPPAYPGSSAMFR
ncbi:hypothetical protein L218DRAFT_1003016 [Marasmius fiardii PR-910]|nr:hypothetical protein L218DRAFT_1003016 [Marasmius fiardii PR-910]